MDRDTEREIHELHARICKAIADPKRLLIINVLRDGPMTVNDIAESLELTQSNTSQHLAILRERNIVDTERDGPSVYYSLHSKKVLKAIDLLRERFSCKRNPEVFVPVCQLSRCCLGISSQLAFQCSHQLACFDFRTCERGCILTRENWEIS